MFKFGKNAFQTILFNAILAALIVVVINYILTRRTLKNLMVSGGAYNNSDRGLTSRVKSSSINVNQILSADSVGNEAEIAALQILVNLYNEEKYVNVDGIWSDKLTTAVQHMTGGQTAVSLYNLIQVEFPRLEPERYTNEQLYKLINSQIIV